VSSQLRPQDFRSNFCADPKIIGRSYYYNAETKQSTYTRPAAEAAAPNPLQDTNTLLLPPQTGSSNQSPDFNSGPQTSLPFQQRPGPIGSGDFRGGRSYQNRHNRQPEDRPKSKHAIPGCEPWLLVKTKLGRRFVYDPEANESFWKFPEHVLKGVVEYDRLERGKKERRERGEASEDENVPVDAKEGGNEDATGPALGQHKHIEDDSDEYEEVEVTDEDEEGGENLTKRARTNYGEEDGDQPVEFNEDDIAYQLAQIGQDYGDEYDNGEDGAWEDGDEGAILTEDDSEALFHDLLEDFRINPYRTWEQIIDDGRIIEDPRYVALPTTKARKEFYSRWSKDKIQVLREQREKEEKRDPKIRYVAFLQAHATPKLYWPEFRRKFKKEPEMKDTSLADKEKEKMYRDHINRLKLPESTRKSDLSVLLKAAPLTSLNAKSTVDTLPTSIITDLRYISLAPQVRDPLVETYISTLSPAPEPAGLSAEDSEETKKTKLEREKREKALADRERRVQEEKRKQHGALRQGREILGREEAELQRAMRVERGKEGLRGYMDADEKQEKNGDQE
jgi:FF domain